MATIITLMSLFNAALIIMLHDDSRSLTFFSTICQHLEKTKKKLFPTYQTLYFIPYYKVKIIKK